MRDQVIAKNRKSKPCPVRTPIPPFPFLLDTRLHVTGAHLHRTIQIRRPPRSGAHLSVSASVEEGARTIRLLPIPLTPPPPHHLRLARCFFSSLRLSLSLPSRWIWRARHHRLRRRGRHPHSSASGRRRCPLPGRSACSLPRHVSCLDLAEAMRFRFSGLSLELRFCGDHFLIGEKAGSGCSGGGFVLSLGIFFCGGWSGCYVRACDGTLGWSCGVDVGLMLAKFVLDPSWLIHEDCFRKKF